jgi:hypothetical protein
MKVAMVHLLICSALSLAPLPAYSFLADDFNSADFPRRLIVGGELVPTPPGRGKAWDGGQGWQSRMRIDANFADFYGRRDYVYYRWLEPGTDLPVEQGTLELWIQRQNADPVEASSDNLVELFDEAGETLLAIAVTWADPPAQGAVNIWKAADVWGENLSLPPVAIGGWIHLGFTWGPRGAEDNRVYANGSEMRDPASICSGSLAATMSKARSLRLGLGGHDSDPAWHTLIDEFRFSGTVRQTFELDRSLLTTSSESH